jgi:hypothetical protein
MADGGWRMAKVCRETLYLGRFTWDGSLGRFIWDDVDKN